MAILSYKITFFMTLMFTLNGYAIINDNDDRIEAHEVQSGLLKKLSDSTVAVFMKSETRLSGGKLTLRKAPLFAENWGLCQESRFRNQPTHSFCTGTLVGPDLVITAAHCVSESGSFESGWCKKNVRFAFGYKTDLNGNTPRTLPGSETYECSKIVALENDLRSDSDYYDIALVKLDRKVVGHEPVRVNRSTEIIPMDTAITLIGYPAGLPQKIDPAGKIKNSRFNPSSFSVGFDSLGGNSGSPVFNSTTGLLEGVLGAKITIDYSRVPARKFSGDMDFIADLTRECNVENQKDFSKTYGDSVTRVSKILKHIPEI